MTYCIKIELPETYELFDDIKKAFEFCDKNKKDDIRISLVKANNTYKEDSGELNYEDYADTIEEEIK